MPEEPKSGAAAPAASAPTNVWDAIRALAAIVALVVLVIVLVNHYDEDANKAASILGIVVPAFAAVFGVTVGYATGAQQGQAKGEANKQAAVDAARMKLIEKVEPRLARLEEHEPSILEPIVEMLESRGGEVDYVLPANQPLEQALTVRKDDVDSVTQAVAELRGIVDAAK